MSVVDQRSVPLEIVRRQLLERIDRGRARIVSLVAPAGFGKSTTALQIAAASGHVLVCDCAELAAEVDFATRLVAVLASDPHARNGSFLIQCRLALGIATIPLEERLSAVVLAWRNANDTAAYVFENAEHLACSPGGMRLFSRLLSNLPQARRLIVCSRVPLPLRLSRYVAPDALETLVARDLAFAEGELEEAFTGCAVSRHLVERAMAVSRGWPMVAMLLARFAREGRLAGMLDRLDDVAFDDVRDYLAEEVLSTLDDDVLHGLAVSAFVPKARRSDVDVALGRQRAMDAFDTFLRSTPLLAIVDGTYELHPLIRAAIVERCAERKRPILQVVADEAERDGDDIRAAQMHIARGDNEAAAAALNRIDWIERPSPSLEQLQILGALDRASICKYPRLWAVTILLGRFSFDPHVAIGEAHALLRAMDSSTPSAVRSYVVRPLAGFLSRLGMHDLGYRMIRDHEAEARIPEAPESFAQAAVVYIRMMIAGRMGRLIEFREQAARAWPYAGKNDGMSTLLLVERAAEVERAEGRRDEERGTLEDALVRARRSGVVVNVAFALAEGAFGAWLSGEEEAYRRLIDELDSTVQRDGVRGFVFFVDCARGRFERAPNGTELPKWIVCAHLLACTSSTNDRERARHAVAASEAALQYGAPFVQVLASLAAAAYVPDRKREWLELAIRSARRVESEPLGDAVAAFVGGEADCGMLDAFARRLRTRFAAASDSVEIDVLSASVRLGQASVKLSGRKLELTIALACRRTPTSRKALQELLWSDLDEPAAQNALNICLHHVRRLLGNSVVRTADGYALDGATRVDLWEIEDVLARARPRAILGEFERIALTRWYAKLCDRRRGRTPDWIWFEAHERRIAELRSEIAERLAREALAAGEPDRAIEFARAIVAYDPCDEPARAIIIRSHLLAGERAAAKREYRRYAAVLARELQAAPAFAFEDLAPRSAIRTGADESRSCGRHDGSLAGFESPPQQAGGARVTRASERSWKVAPAIVLDAGDSSPASLEEG